MNELSLQELYAPGSACFGCGPANEKGLHVRSYPSGEGDEVVCEWRPEPQYEAFPGVLNGGIVGALLDCHSNWAAAYHFMRRAGAERTPGTVTADYSVKLLRPTPTDTTLFRSLGRRLAPHAARRPRKPALHRHRRLLGQAAAPHAVRHRAEARREIGRAHV